MTFQKSKLSARPSQQKCEKGARSVRINCDEQERGGCVAPLGLPLSITRIVITWMKALLMRTKFLAPCRACRSDGFLLPLHAASRKPSRPPPVVTVIDSSATRAAASSNQAESIHFQSPVRPSSAPAAHPASVRGSPRKEHLVAEVVELKPASSVRGRKHAHDQHCAVCFGSNMIVCGGRVGGAATVTLGAYNYEHNEWKYIKAAGPSPPSLSGHTCTMWNDIAIVVGGLPLANDADDVGFYTLNCQMMQWTFYPTSATLSDPNRWPQDIELGRNPNITRRHSAVRLGEALYVFGGCKGEQKLRTNQLDILDLRAMKWVSTAPFKEALSSPPPLSDHSAVAYLDDKVFVYGGKDAVEDRSNEMYVYNVSGRRFSHVDGTGSGPVQGRSGHVAAAAGVFMYVFGGEVDVKQLTNELFQFNMEQYVWSAVQTQGSPLPCVVNCSIVAAHPPESPREDGVDAAPTTELTLLGGCGFGSRSVLCCHCVSTSVIAAAHFHQKKQPHLSIDGTTTTLQRGKSKHS